MSESSETVPLHLLDSLAQSFEWQAANAYGVGLARPDRGASTKHASPLYMSLARAAAQDPSLLALVARAEPSQAANLLMGAVHYLLLTGAASPLALYFPSLVAHPRPPEEAFPAFRAFVLEHAAEIRRLVTTRSVQTNEVGRCALLAPAFVEVARRGGEQPLALVEIGASAGLNLLWDHYGYQYGESAKLGDPASPVQIRCEVQGSRVPPVAAALPNVLHRVGIDLAPVDLYHEEAVRWLRALIWPEHADRAALLYHAVQVARQSPPRLLAGDALELLPPTLQNAPTGTTLCVFHSLTLYQVDDATRERLREALQNFSRRRDLYRVSLEWRGDPPRACLDLLTYRDGHEESELLAYGDSHGRAIEWQSGFLEKHSET